jgi:hypothetical protein
MKPFTILGYSCDDEVLCPPCLRSTTPITGEVVVHTCRGGRVPLPDRIRREVLARNAAGDRPATIAKALDLSVYRVNRVLSGEEDDHVPCPACLGRRGSEASCTPLYFADQSVREEVCTRCGKLLVELATRADATSPPPQVTRDTYRTRNRDLPALRFDRAPPASILGELKRLGWRWAPDAKVWIHRGSDVLIPKVLGLAPRKPAIVGARPPVVRKRAIASAAC